MKIAAVTIGTAVIRGLLIIFSVCIGPAANSSDFISITAPCYLEFPRDHGRHPGYRIEWWYYTGNLQSEEGDHFGFQLTFFRYQLKPSDAGAKWPERPSSWRTNQLYFAHAALADLTGKQFLNSEETAREALGIAGVGQHNGMTTVFLKKWSVALGGDEHHLQADAADFSFNLKMKALKAPVLHGNVGYTLKGESSEQSSCYYSFTRLETSGTVVVNGKVFKVKGLSWMDHEFSSEPLDENAAGWDWFSLQLDNGTELMIYIIRMASGLANPASSATFIDAAGEPVHFILQDFSIDVLDTWKSPHTGAIYPSKWRVTLIALGMELVIESNLADQEMQSPHSTGITYWEGSVSIRGKSMGKSVGGAGYVELTGYEKPLGYKKP